MWKQVDEVNVLAILFLSVTPGRAEYNTVHAHLLSDTCLGKNA